MGKQLSKQDWIFKRRGGGGGEELPDWPWVQSVLFSFEAPLEFHASAFPHYESNKLLLFLPFSFSPALLP